MKARVATKSLRTAVTQASKAISNRATLPVLSGIRLSANGTLEVAATDLEGTVLANVSCVTDEAGSCIVPGKAFAQILKTVSEAEVLISSDDFEVEVIAGRTARRIKSMPTDDYPKLPLGDGDVLADISVDAATLRTQLERTLYAASGDESRQVLTGVHVKIDEHGIEMAATNSYQLAVTPLDAKYVGEWSGVIPARLLTTFVKTALTKRAGDVRILCLDNLVVMVVDHLCFSMRLIDGEFPKYQQLIPEGYPNIATFDAAEMIAVASSVGLMAQNNLPIKLHLTADECEVTAHTPDVGEARDYIKVRYNGEPLVIAFNPDFFIQTCNATGPTVTMQVADGLKPAVLKGDDTLGLIMPVRLS